MCCSLWIRSKTKGLEWECRIQPTGVTLSCQSPFRLIVHLTTIPDFSDIGLSQCSNEASCNFKELHLIFDKALTAFRDP